MLKSILAIIAAIAQHLASPAREKAKKQKTRETIEAEVRRGDEKSVNARLKRNLAIIGALLLIGGCAAPEVVYVNEPDRAWRMEREGIPGWWLPDGLLAPILHSLETCTCPR